MDLAEQPKIEKALEKQPLYPKEEAKLQIDRQMKLMEQIISKNKK